MPTTDFADYVLDQLRLVPGVTCRRMFSGHGFYARGIFFAIVSKGVLYFKTNDATRPRYEAAGSRPFRPTEKVTLKSYYEVPAEVIDHAARLAEWAREAITAQNNVKQNNMKKNPPRRPRHRYTGVE